MSTSTKVSKVQKAINEVVTAFYSDGVSLDDTALSLTQNGVGFSDIQTTIKSVGIKLGLVLTTDLIQKRVVTHIKGKTISHFLDVVELAKSIDLAQLSEQEKQQAIIDFSDVKKSVVKEPSKFKKLHGSGHHGVIADWIKSHPDFTAQELHSSGLISAPNASEYYDEFLAYREFFKA